MLTRSVQMSIHLFILILFVKKYLVTVVNVLFSLLNYNNIVSYSDLCNGTFGKWQGPYGGGGGWWCYPTPSEEWRRGVRDPTVGSRPKVWKNQRLATSTWWCVPHPSIGEVGRNGETTTPRGPTIRSPPIVRFPIAILLLIRLIRPYASKLSLKNALWFGKGLSIKDVRSQGGLSSVDILRTRRRGVLQKQTSAFLGAKNFVFFEIYDGSAQTMGGGGGVPVRTFCRQGEGGNFWRFCADVCYGRPENSWVLERKVLFHRLPSASRGGPFSICIFHIQLFCAVSNTIKI